MTVIRAWEQGGSQRERERIAYGKGMKYDTGIRYGKGIEFGRAGRQAGDIGVLLVFGIVELYSWTISLMNGSMRETLPTV